MTRCAVVPLSFNWTFWYKEKCTEDEDWRTNFQKLFEVSTATQFIEAYNLTKLPSGLPLGASYYFFKKGIQPMWEEEPNKGAGAWIIEVENQMNNDLNLIWSDLLFTLISGGFKELSCYLCGITCYAKHKTFQKVTIWTVKTTPENYEHIMKIGKILQTLKLNVYEIKSLKYKLHNRFSNNFDYVL
ncbi:eukaryotic translation initiation factor 4E-like [Myzus persicae]|uniref:eukaryotic translation initiation factor 4E-like n=1 Tax=Myzus persicae TaxID=13164 RepID=UPI000B935CEC|nr:eukaryotic translation initiation factor 4E-like [Myzus persicae]